MKLESTAGKRRSKQTKITEPSTPDYFFAHLYFAQRYYNRNLCFCQAQDGIVLREGDFVTKQELSRLYVLKSDIEQRKIELAELTSEYDALKGYIESVEDSQMRKILRLKHEENLTWQQIAKQLCGKNTSYGVRKRHYRFFKKNSLT